MHLTVDVELPDRQRLAGLSCERLALAHPFAPGHFVVGGAWVAQWARLFSLSLEGIADASLTMTSAFDGSFPSPHQLLQAWWLHAAVHTVRRLPLLNYYFSDCSRSDDSRATHSSEDWGSIPT